MPAQLAFFVFVVSEFDVAEEDAMPENGSITIVSIANKVTASKLFFNNG